MLSVLLLGADFSLYLFILLKWAEVNMGTVQLSSSWHLIVRSVLQLSLLMLQLVRGTDSLTVDNLRVWVCNSHFSAVITEDSRCLHQQGNV